mgnify:FL=1
MKDFWAEELQNRKKVNVIKVIILIVVLLIFISAIVCTIVYYYNLDFRKWCDENVWKKEIREKDTKSIDLDGDDNTQVYAYEKYICVFRKKKLEFYNKVGTESGKIELDINEAIFTSAGRYMAICEKDGNKFYLICGKEKLYENEVEGNISQINVSKSGYVSIVISNTSYKSVVDVFDKTGNEIFKTNLVTSRVADVSISQDSKYLAIAEIDLSGILIKSSIQVVSIELAKTNPSQAIINKYEAPTDKMILNVEYQEQNKLICMYSDGIESYEEKTSTELIKFDDKKESFMTIELSNRVALVDEISTGEYTANTNIRIIDPNTKKEREYVTGSIAKSIKTSDNKMAINFGTELHLIDKNGILLKKYISDTEINNIVMTDAVVGIVYKDRIQIINF